MNQEIHTNSQFYITYLNIVASILILVQFLFFILLYNFMANIIILGLGWLLLFPGFGLVLFSSNSQRTYSETEIVHNSILFKFEPYSMPLGWIIISLSLTLISQQWYAIILTLGFIMVIIFELRLQEAVH